MSGYINDWDGGWGDCGWGGYRDPNRGRRRGDTITNVNINIINGDDDLGNLEDTLGQAGLKKTQIDSVVNQVRSQKKR
ncbi:hypothetical protein [Marininema halotolerans]|uniref:Uncharacterized protein n=1 Tax=Marininema halotolerans TaxID=1155944 RepID=A0A1I6R313_9BACL|nr:hypothetical protein [Marininema halotolerans]SFS59092.1 hypothetical protein SAMN05444972_10468 [Marininema halotolerans]